MTDSNVNGSAAEPLLTRVARATKSVGVLSKDRSNAHDGYDYLSEAAVKRAVQEVIAEHDIAPKHIDFEALSDEWLKAKNGGEYNLIKLRCILKWEDGSSVQGLGAGRDYGDKALMKAQTAAVREAWKNRFTIPTGEDPEKDDRARNGSGRAQPQRPAPRPAPAQPQTQTQGAAPKAPAKIPPSKLQQADKAQELIAELVKLEHPADLFAWSNDVRKLPQDQRAPLWAAFGDHCKARGLQPGDIVRGNGAVT